MRKTQFAVWGNGQWDRAFKKEEEANKYIAEKQAKYPRVPFELRHEATMETRERRFKIMTRRK